MNTNSYLQERNERLINRAFFNVGKIKNGNGKYDIVDLDRGTAISEVSDRYTLIKNEDLFRPFLDKFGKENLFSVENYGQYKHYVVKIFTGRIFNLGTDAEEDLVKELLMIQNSYDKSRAYSFRLGAWRKVCSNGLYALTDFLLNYRKIHVGEIPYKEMVNTVLNNYERNTFENWRKLKEIPLTLEQEVKIIETFTPFNEKNNKGEELYTNIDVNRKIRFYAKRNVNREENINNQRNGWGLMNGINRSIGNILSGTSQITRVVKANNKLEEYLLKYLNIN